MKGPPDIKRPRVCAKLTLRALSKATGIPYGTLGRIELGKMIGSRRVRRILSAFFGVDLSFDVCPLCKSKSREK